MPCVRDWWHCRVGAGHNEVAMRSASSLMEPDFARVLSSETSKEYESSVITFARRLGFDSVSATLITEKLDGSTTFDTVHNTPNGYLPGFTDVQNGQRDPVMQHCKRHNLPIIWDQSTYLAAGAIEKWEVQAQFGYRCGIAVVMHLPGGRHYFLGVDRDQAIPQDAGEVTAMVSKLQTFAVHAHEAAAKVLAQDAVAD